MSSQLDAILGKISYNSLNKYRELSNRIDFKQLCELLGADYSDDQEVQFNIAKNILQQLKNQEFLISKLSNEIGLDSLADFNKWFSFNLPYCSTVPQHLKNIYQILSLDYYILHDSGANGFADLVDELFKEKLDIVRKIKDYLELNYRLNELKDEDIQDYASKVQVCLQNFNQGNNFFPLLQKSLKQSFKNGLELKIEVQTKLIVKSSEITDSQQQPANNRHSNVKIPQPLAALSGDQRPYVTKTSALSKPKLIYDGSAQISVSPANKTRLRSMMRSRIQTVMKGGRSLNEKVVFEYEEPNIGTQAQEIVKALGDLRQIEGIEGAQFALKFSADSIEMALKK